MLIHESTWLCLGLFGEILWSKLFRNCEISVKLSLYICLLIPDIKNNYLHFYYFEIIKSVHFLPNSYSDINFTYMVFPGHFWPCDNWHTFLGVHNTNTINWLISFQVKFKMLVLDYDVFRGLVLLPVSGLITDYNLIFPNLLSHSEKISLRSHAFKKQRESKLGGTAFQ